MKTRIFDHFINLNSPDSCSLFYDGIGKDNLIFLAESNSISHHGFMGPASIKYNITGTTYYEFDSVRLTNKKKFIYLNKDHFYTCESIANEKVKSLIIFFPHNFFKSIVESIERTDEKLLDNYKHHFSPSLNFFEGLYDISEIQPLFDKLMRSISNKSSELEIQILLHQIGYCFIKGQIDILSLIEKQQAIKRSTKIELYKRVSRCKDHIECNYEKQISLADLAHISQMAPHHFLRVFKSFYNQSPYQFLIRIRMNKAKELLDYTNLAITDIASKIGINDLSSLSRTFYDQFRISPTNYRKLCKV